MDNKEAEFRCQIAYEQLSKVFNSLIQFKKIEDAEELQEIMRQLIIYSERFHR